MKATLLYHTVTCCRFDCMVRHCTCRAVPVEVESDEPLQGVLQNAARSSGDLREDGRRVDRLAYWERTPEGVLLEFTTTAPEEEEAE